MIAKYFKNVSWFLVIFVTLLYRCYNYVPLLPYTQLMSFITLLLYAYIIFIGRNSFSNSVFRMEKYIFGGLIMTMIVSLLYWNTSIFNVISRYYLPASVLVVFFLKSKRIDSSKVENSIVVLTWIYITCWFLQVLEVPRIIFGTRDELDDLSRGFVRFYINTKENLPFLIFYYLSLYNNNRNKIYIVIAFIIFVIVVLHVTRQMIFWSALFALLYLISQNMKHIKSILLLAGMISIMGYYFISNSEVVSSLISVTENSEGGVNSLSTDNIRFEAITYFIHNYSDNLFTILFGNGFPSMNDSLAKYEDSFKMMGYYKADVGFVGMYCDTGLISVILYIILLIKTIFFTRTDKRYSYLKYYIAYMVCSYFGSHTLTSDVVFVILSMYILKINEIKLIEK